MGEGDDVGPVVVRPCRPSQFQHCACNPSSGVLFFVFNVAAYNGSATSSEELCWGLPPLLGCAPSRQDEPVVHHR